MSMDRLRVVAATAVLTLMPPGLLLIVK